MRLLLLSNSTNVGGTFLGHAGDWLRDHLSGARNVVFLPFAAVRFSYDEFAAMSDPRIPRKHETGRLRAQVSPMLLSDLRQAPRSPTRRHAE